MKLNLRIYLWTPSPLCWLCCPLRRSCLKTIQDEPIGFKHLVNGTRPIRIKKICKSSDHLQWQKFSWPMNTMHFQHHLLKNITYDQTLDSTMPSKNTGTQWCTTHRPLPFSGELGLQATGRYTSLLQHTAHKVSVHTEWWGVNGQQNWGREREKKKKRKKKKS